MQWIIIREVPGHSPEQGVDLLRYALSTPPLPRVVLEGLRHLGYHGTRGNGTARMGGTKPEESLWILPGRWQADVGTVPGRAVFFDKELHLDVPARPDRRREAWQAIRNGRFAVQVNPQLLGRFLAATRADVIAVTVAPDLRAGGERLRLTPDNKVVGYRRLYADALSPAPLPADWPHLLFVRREVSGAVLNSGLLASFAAWIDTCRAAGLRCQSLAAAGSAYDLGSAEGILTVSRVALSHSARWGATRRQGEEQRMSPAGEQGEVSPLAHVIGPVLLGRQVAVAADAVIVGPSILCDGSAVGRGTLVDSSIVGSGVSVEPGQSLRGCVVTPSAGGHVAGRRIVGRTGRPREHPGRHGSGVFRVWPKFSYARCFKRMADVVAAAFILILFAPVIPVIALAIKLGSPGPAFFADKRQGLHGRPFRCVKFRTMRQGADKIQDKLRFVSEVDGPQFKIADDPRITTVGRFLRETHLDEIPQFFNVLWGQMSVVGPRPSPEAENTLCPSWRDARLSVRPGITGLWQVYCTREPQKDFQEWIHYDMQYVRDFSLGLDFWICWRTLLKMVGLFVRQF